MYNRNEQLNRNEQSTNSPDGIDDIWTKFYAKRAQQYLCRLLRPKRRCPQDFVRILISL